ncbi:MAG: NADH-quinone oxidoreductase subunit J [Anaerolineales bacterium]|nr:MAG: NADH-quinone oxidoreductase subunit J [Anaerolineales bacterium]
MVQTVVFIILSLITLGAALAVVTSKNLFHSALFLILSFVGVAGLYVLLEAPFLAAVQILVYVGAIAILIVFAIMLTRRLMAKDLVQHNAQWGWAALGAVLLFVALGLILLQVNWPVVEAAVPEETISILGQDLMGTYLVPFEVASVLLLVALVGSIIIARERE